jgi:hypothetical protein
MVIDPFVKTIDQSKTEVFCAVMEEERESIVGWLGSFQQRSFAQHIFDSIEKRVLRICSG